METWILLVAIALTITASGFVQSAMGFGFGIVAFVVLPFIVDVRLAHVVVSLSMIGPLSVAVWAYRRGIDWPTGGCCLGGAMLGLPLGLLVFSSVEAGWLVRGTGVAILLMALDGLMVRRERSKQSPLSHWWSAVAGAASGLLSGSIGMGGPPIAAYAARQPWSPRRFKAFLISFSFVLSLLKVSALTVAGWIDQTVLFNCAVAMPFGLAGCQLGIMVSRKIKTRRFRQITMGVLVCLAIGMIYRGQPQHNSTGPKGWQATSAGHAGQPSTYRVSPSSPLQSTTYSPRRATR